MMRLKNLSFILFSISYILMLVLNIPSLMYLPEVVVLISVLLFGASETFICFMCFMCFSYPTVNAVCALIIFIALLVEKHRIKVIDKKSTYIILLFTLWTLIDSAFTRINGSNWNDSISWMYVLILLIICQNLSQHYLHDVFKSIQSAGFILVGLQLICLLYSPVNNLLTNTSTIRIPDINNRSILFATCILLTEYLTSKKIELKVFGIIKIALFVFGIFALGARGIMALILVYFALRYVLIGEVSSKVLVRKTVIAVFVAVGGIYFLQTEVAAEILANLQSITSLTMHSNAVRIRLYSDIIGKMIPSNFLMGIGSGNFALTYPSYASIPFHADHAHSIYLQIFSESGVIGFIIVMILIFNYIKRTLRSLFEKKIALIRTCAYVNFFFLIYGLVENTWGDSRSMTIFFAINCATFVISSNEAQNGIEIM